MKHCLMCFGAHHVKFKKKLNHISVICCNCGNEITRLEYPDWLRFRQRDWYVKQMNRLNKGVFA